MLLRCRALAYLGPWAECARAARSTGQGIASTPRGLPTSSTEWWELWHQSMSTRVPAAAPGASVPKGNAHVWSDVCSPAVGVNTKAAGRQGPWGRCARSQARHPFHARRASIFKQCLKCHDRRANLALSAGRTLHRSTFKKKEATAHTSRMRTSRRLTRGS